MQQFTTINLDTFCNQWLYRPDVLDLQATWTYDVHTSQLEIIFEQKQSSGFYFNVPLEIELIENGGKAKRIIMVDMNSKFKIYKIPLDQKPAAILPDPRTVLLAKFEVREG